MIGVCAAKTNASKIRGMVDAGRLRELFEAIEPELVRYPAIDADVFREKLEEFLRGEAGRG